MSVSLIQPPVGSTGWGGDVNNNFAQIEAALESVGFRATQSTGQSITQFPAEPVVTWNATEFNEGGAFDVSTERFTAPVTGIYFFECSVLYVNFGALKAADLRFYAGNPTLTRRCISSYCVNPAFGDYGAALSTSLYLNAGEIVEVRTVQQDTVARSLAAAAAYNWWSGFLVSKT